MIQYPSPATMVKPTAYRQILPVLRVPPSLYATGLKLVLLFLILHLVSALHAQKETSYVVQSNIIYRLKKNLDWPASSKQGDFNIGVVGDSPMYEELKKSIEGKFVGDQKITIKKVSSSSPVFDCQILFVSDDAGKNIKKIAGKTAHNPVLLVSETDGMAQKGSCINFVIESNRLKLEINQNNITQRELSIASELLQLGKLVK
jgi:hypothetical protein